MGKKFRIATLGCRTNQYESEAYKNQLEALGFEAAGEGEAADLCLVNTCTVTAGADRESRHQIRRLRRDHPEAKLVVTGCLVEEGAEALASLPEIDQIVANKEKERLIEQLFPGHDHYPEFQIAQFEAHTRAFVKVQDGCNSFCTYCIIPYVRGRSRSRTVAEVVAEVEGLVANGYREIVLTGINIGDFDGGSPESGHRLSDLVRAVDKVSGLDRLRLSSIDPDEVDEELQAAILEGRSCCPSLHLVLQSGSNVVLKRMNRKYNRQLFLETVDRLRRAEPDFCFTTDVIYGFPGESEREVEETAEVIREVEFAKVHLFPYSPRPRTRAALYPNQIPAAVMAERKQFLSQVAERAAWSCRERYLGRTMELLVEGENKGHTANFLSVELAGPPVEPNQIVPVRFIANEPHALIGEVIS